MFSIFCPFMFLSIFLSGFRPPFSSVGFLQFLWILLNCVCIFCACFYIQFTYKMPYHMNWTKVDCPCRCNFHPGEHWVQVPAIRNCTQVENLCCEFHHKSAQHSSLQYSKVSVRHELIPQPLQFMSSSSCLFHVEQPQMPDEQLHIDFNFFFFAKLCLHKDTADSNWVSVVTI